MEALAKTLLAALAGQALGDGPALQAFLNKLTLALASLLITGLMIAALIGLGLLALYHTLVLQGLSIGAACGLITLLLLLIIAVSWLLTQKQFAALSRLEPNTDTIGNSLLLMEELALAFVAGAWQADAKVETRLPAEQAETPPAESAGASDVPPSS